MVHDHSFFHRNRIAWIVIRAAKVISEQPFRNILGCNPPVGEQGGDVENLYLLIQRCVFRDGQSGIMQLCMSNLMDCSAHGLHFAHAFADTDLLVFQAQETIRAVLHGGFFYGKWR